ncbi:uncharacterized protein LOC106061993 isoform X2 [Biomphalaria glabrata]|nr:uncharacterized protein LOC106061993 isoform X2 [Biomphalaria glabrata]
MENCLKRRDLDSGSELEDTEGSELDNDMDSGERKDLLVSPSEESGQYQPEYDSGLISPYKRLRVEDLAHTSAESHIGEEEAHSLLRSIDGCDISWSKFTGATSVEDFGQSTNNNSNSPTISSLETRKDTTPRRQLVKRGTSIDEALLADSREREFPLPPAIDKRQTSTHTRELDSLLLASYHPDFQTLESRHISYQSRCNSPVVSTQTLSVSRQNSGSNTQDSFDLLEIHAEEEPTDSPSDAIYEEMPEKEASDPTSVKTEASSAGSLACTKLTQLENLKSVGISTQGLPIRVSPLPVASSLASTLSSSSQRETLSDGVSAVYDTVDSEPEGTAWPKLMLDGGLSSGLPKPATSSGVSTKEMQELKPIPNSGSQLFSSLRSLSGDGHANREMNLELNQFSQAHGTKSLSWDDICQQYQQHLQYQFTTESQPYTTPQDYQLPQQYIMPIPPAGPTSLDMAQSAGTREMLSYLGYHSKNRHSSQRSLKSCSSQESGRHQKSTNSRSSQESIERTEKSYPSSLVISDHTSKKAFLQSPGHLKLSAYWNVGLLTVHVIQARCLSSAWASHCDSYVKMSLVPDESRRTRCKTQVQLTSNNPVYDEKFSMEILEEDRRKRLLISVWHKDPSNGASEFLGCMSFGVQSLLEKDLDGWYYLLTEEVGRKKHLQAHTKPKPVLTARNHQNIPQINKAVEGLERIVITVQRGKNGFGFSFVDEFPPKVGRVDRASPAEQAGVKKGDMVIRINGQNVSRSTCEGVAHLVKKLNAHSITLELQREHVIKNTVEISTSASSNPHHPSPYNKRGVGTSTDHLYESITDRSDHHKENWVNGSQDEFLTDDDTAYYHQNDQPKAITSTPRPFIKPTHRTVSTASLPTTNKHESIHRLMSLELDYIDFMHYGIERYSRPLRHCIVSAQQHMALFQNVEKLVTISEYHIKQMQDNTSSVDSDTEDSQSSESSMFPNSVALIYQSKVHMLCQAYESYANGLASSNTLLKELRKNRDFMSFVKDTPSEDGQNFGQPTISAFINRPVQHIQELCMVLSEIFAATPLHSPDFATLQQIVIKLSQCVTAITGLSSAGRVQSLDSLASSQGQTSSKAASSSKGSMASLSSCSSAEADARCPLMPSSTASVRSLDRDVLRVQERLVLAPSVPAFQLCQESRHLIYQGNIYRCERGSWFKSQLLLFSDLLLIVDEEPDGALLVTSSPTLIQDISGIEINRKYASEFVLHLQPATASTLPRRQPLTSSSGKAKAIVLRAPSAQEKFVWQSLLEQRVAAVNGSKLQHYGSMRDISNAKTSIIL